MQAMSFFIWRCANNFALSRKEKLALLEDHFLMHLTKMDRLNWDPPLYLMPLPVPLAIINELIKQNHGTNREYYEHFQPDVEWRLPLNDVIQLTLGDVVNDKKFSDKDRKLVLQNMIDLSQCKENLSNHKSAQQVDQRKQMQQPPIAMLSKGELIRQQAEADQAMVELLDLLELESSTKKKNSRTSAPKPKLLAAVKNKQLVLNVRLECCRQCGVERDKSGYSKSQWRKKTGLMCIACNNRVKE
jgi:hypothetical protein